MKFMIGSNELPEIVERDIAQLMHWENNPRTVEKKDMNRLIEQIKLLGVYKPLLINQDNIILGGNMRFEALQSLGVKKTLCSLVRTDNPAQMMDYAASDNDQIGVTDEQQIAEFVSKHGDVRSELFAINSSPMQPLNSVLQQFKPEESAKPKSNVYSINVAFNDLATLETALVEIQNICENYEIRGISVNDGSKQD